MNDKALSPTGFEVFKRLVRELATKFPKGLQTGSHLSSWKKPSVEQQLPRIRLKDHCEHHSRQL